MSRSTLLRFAEQGDFSQLRAFSGDLLYTEGMPATQMYVIKDGEVDLYLVRDEKRTVLETLRKGQCFGFEAHLKVQTRIHCAAAHSYCELLLIDNPTVMAAIADSPAWVGALLETHSARLAVAHELIAQRVNYQPDLLIYAKLLQLLGAADIGKPSAPRRHGPAAPQLARPLLQEVFNTARLLFGHSDTHIRQILGKFLSLHLVRIEDESGNGKQVLFSPADIMEQARKLTQGKPGQEKASYQYISVDELAALVEVDRATLLKKLAGGEFADDVFTFRRAEVMQLLSDKGRRYFAERKIKPPAEFSEMADLEFADSKSIFAAVSKVDSFDLAKLLSTLEDGAARSKVLNSLSKRRREEVESDLAGLAAVDPADVHQIGQAIVEDVKLLMAPA